MFFMGTTDALFVELVRTAVIVAGFRALFGLLNSLSHELDFTLNTVVMFYSCWLWGLWWTMPLWLLKTRLDFPRGKYYHYPSGQEESSR